jgi:hypothetical protein
MTISKRIRQISWFFIFGIKSAMLSIYKTPVLEGKYRKIIGCNYFGLWFTNSLLGKKE